MAEQKIIDLGVDYLRFTVPLSSPHVERLERIAANTMYDHETKTNPIRDGKFLQFQGLKTDSVFFGSSDRHALIQVSGGHAKQVAKEIKDEEIIGKCTRIDFQQTIDYGEKEIDISNRIEQEIRAWEKERGSGRQFKFTAFKGDDFDTGFTAFDRTSSRYFRFYHARSGGHGNHEDSVYRAEFELKEERAVQGWWAFGAAEDENQFITALVQGEMQRMGIFEQWFGSEIPVTLSPVYEPQSAERSLKWLRNQVMPRITKLHEQGYGKEVEAMLKAAFSISPEEQKIRTSLERQKWNDKYFAWRKKNANL